MHILPRCRARKGTGFGWVPASATVSSKPIAPPSTAARLNALPGRLSSTRPPPENGWQGAGKDSDIKEVAAAGHVLDVEFEGVPHGEPAAPADLPQAGNTRLHGK